MIYKVHWIIDGIAEIEAETKEEALYASRHESTPSSEKAAEAIVTKHESIAREAMKNQDNKS